MMPLQITSRSDTKFALQSIQNKDFSQVEEKIVAV
jgi:hypothetical protein